MKQPIRINDFTLQLGDKLESKIYANANIDIERTAVEEAYDFSAIEGISHLSFTPDFHKGAGTPIGTVALIDRVYPKVVGNDIGCGMRFDITNLKSLEITDQLKNNLRGMFFEGKREVLVPKGERAKILIDSLNRVKLEGRSVERIPNQNFCFMEGALGLGELSPILRRYFTIDSIRDNFLGTIGGGNHFIEIQVVDEIVDKTRAYHQGLKLGQICIMVHSGSLDNGHEVGNYFKDLAKSEHVGKHPSNGYYALNKSASEEYVSASGNAANFATVNRAVLASMAAEVLDCELTSVYDLPHNFVEDYYGEFVHRKGACPAYDNDVIIVPGSMGTRSCIAEGLNFSGTLASAPHGAGRVLNRNASRKNIEDLKTIELVTKIDPLKVRLDVSHEVYKSLAEEAPRSYKDISEVVNTVTASGIGNVIAWTKPVLTLKG